MKRAQTRKQQKKEKQQGLFSAVTKILDDRKTLSSASLEHPLTTTSPRIDVASVEEPLNKTEMRQSEP